MNNQETIAWHKGKIAGLRTLRNELSQIRQSIEEWIRIEKIQLKELGVKK